MSSFNPNIPASSDYMLQSQPQIRANFQAIFAAFAQNHENLNQPLQGAHDVILFKEKSDPTTDANQIALYTKPISSLPCLFYRPNSSQDPIQLTYSSISTGKDNATPSKYLLQQYSFLAGPFVVYTGIFNDIASGYLATMTPSTTLLYVGLTILGAGSHPIPPAVADPNVFATACATNVNGATGTTPGVFNVQFDASLPVQKVSYFIIGQP
jgi:hypothetical protein